MQRDNRVAVITGASRGIGAAIARAMAASGHTVVIHYNNNHDAATALADEITNDGGQVATISADLAAEDGPDMFWSRYDAALEALSLPPRADILVNNAGINCRGTIDTLTVPNFDALVSVNQRAPFFITRHALDRMSSGGRIVNISSGSARYARPDVIAYAMTKGAIEVFTRTLAVQVGQRGITVNAVAPGALDTDMNAQWLHTDTEAARSAATHTASGRLATPEDIANVVVFLSSPAAAAITGQIIDATNGNRL
ncbi:SDR family oxidoreductase [Rhodococcus pyridinivorans]|uniref:SDR family NAD(P)-dependent oxidoreductase n=1 Tax=Rhodococcus pyridinivorans TaxID=103816 RepID=UPI00200A1BF0|nr:SDR family oxidoreductase [Rhodococcus pyridinivorans]UPW02973.1 SDR family oxidoreductase [Rhodococcus pyridinivorans]